MKNTKTSTSRTNSSSWSTPLKIQMIKSQLQASTDAGYMDSEEFFNKYFNMYDDREFKKKIIKRMWKMPDHWEWLERKQSNLVVQYV